MAIIFPSLYFFENHFLDYEVVLKYESPYKITVTFEKDSGYLIIGSDYEVNEQVIRGLNTYRILNNGSYRTSAIASDGSYLDFNATGTAPSDHGMRIRCLIGPIIILKYKNKLM